MISMIWLIIIWWKCGPEGAVEPLDDTWWKLNEVHITFPLCVLTVQEQLSKTKLAASVQTLECSRFIILLISQTVPETWISCYLPDLWMYSTCNPRLKLPFGYPDACSISSTIWVFLFCQCQQSRSSSLWTLRCSFLQWLTFCTNACSITGEHWHISDQTTIGA